jgi:hypothetical protein
MYVYLHNTMYSFQSLSYVKESFFKGLVIMSKIKKYVFMLQCLGIIFVYRVPLYSAQWGNFQFIIKW